MRLKFLWTTARCAGAVLIDSGPTRLVLFESESGAYYGLDEVGEMVWGLCDGAHAVSEIVTELCEEYDATLEIIQTDLLELLPR